MSFRPVRSIAVLDAGRQTNRPPPTERRIPTGTLPQKKTDSNNKSKHKSHRLPLPPPMTTATTTAAPETTTTSHQAPRGERDDQREHPGEARRELEERGKAADCLQHGSEAPVPLEVPLHGLLGHHHVRRHRCRQLQKDSVCVVVVGINANDAKQCGRCQMIK